MIAWQQYSWNFVAPVRFDAPRTTSANLSCWRWHQEVQIGVRDRLKLKGITRPDAMIQSPSHGPPPNMFPDDLLLVLGAEQR